MELDGHGRRLYARRSTLAALVIAATGGRMSAAAHGHVLV
jgi:hypothetical protein